MSKLYEVTKKPIKRLLKILHLHDEHSKSWRRKTMNHLPGWIGVQRYRLMQRRQYGTLTRTFDEARNLCVGRFNEHEAYPYEEYLLEKYEGPYHRALDFGCGMGRMICRMLRRFEYVDGADLMETNLRHAERYLREQREGISPCKLFKTSGLGCEIEIPYKYDFIYSTICLQHIPVHRIRFQIFADLCSLLNEGGAACFQMGFGMDNGVHWFDNEYGADASNAGLDVSIPDESHFRVIEQDLKAARFSIVDFAIKPSPHPDLRGYHTHWIFIHVRK
jgi:SAM-dependent methyltransferase